MVNFIKSVLRTVIKILNQLGFDFKKIISLKFYPRFRQNKKEWISKGGIIDYNCMILHDFEDYAGIAKGEYFHQDLLVANLIFKANPKRHIDVGSRIDGFVAHVASFRKIEVVDIRFLENSEHENIKFIQADLMKIDNLGEIDSVSCLHVIEHFGLGRYGDAIDIDGHNKGIKNLVNLVSKNGYLYISFPIADEDKVYFNAYRRFKFDTIFKHPSIKEFMKLIRFDFIDEFGNLHIDIKINDFDINIKKKYGCGIYTFKKIND